MQELKFKLKKNGRCVGYMKIAHRSNGPFLAQTYREFDDPLGRWWLECPVEMKAFDSIHPFVCQDRTGKEVYEGDSIRWDKKLWTVKWDPIDCSYIAWTDGNAMPYLNPKDIELLDPETGGNDA